MTDEPLQFATLEEAIEEVRQGRMIIIVDDEDRENEGDLTIPAPPSAGALKGTVWTPPRSSS